MSSSFDPRLVSCVDWKKIYKDYCLPKPLSCSECGSSSSVQFCSGCHKVAYCGKDHQKLHWKRSHKNQCCPYKLVSSPGVGRYLIATRDIDPGEIIFEESPITVGPKQYTNPVCLGCYKSVDGSYRCSRCDWPMCDKVCESVPIHGLECAILSSCPYKPVLKSESLPIYECITPLRCLLIKSASEDNWNVIESMEQHTEVRKGDESYPINQINIVAFIRNHLLDASEDEINSVINVLDVNAFEIRSSSFSIRGVFPMTAMMNSVCTPNTQNCIDQDYICRVRAAVGIVKGEEITTCYTLTLCGTKYRRQHLRETKYFNCDCKRCSDPTELNSHFSTLLCAELLGGMFPCKGFVLPENSLNFLSDWKCLRCFRVYGSLEIDSIIENLEREAASLSSQDKIVMEKFLETRLEPVLHPNHYVIVDFKFNLIQVYGRSPPKPELLSEVLRKKDLVESVLDVMTSVTPGHFRLRGMLLFELFAILWFLFKQNQENNVNKIESVLDEAMEILSYEPEGTVEGDRFIAAQKFKVQMTRLIK